MVEYECVAFVDGDQSDEHADECGFACAVVAEQADDFILADGHVEVVDDDLLLKDLGEVADHDVLLALVDRACAEGHLHAVPRLLFAASTP